MPRDGVDGSLTISTSTADGARTASIYQDRDCRHVVYQGSYRAQKRHGARMLHGNSGPTSKWIWTAANSSSVTVWHRRRTLFKKFDLSLDDYVDRYFIGHYSPAGNHFFAHAIKDAIVDWLDPKPITYRDDEQAGIDFRNGYLPES